MFKQEESKTLINMTPNRNEKFEVRPIFCSYTSIAYIKGKIEEETCSFELPSFRYFVQDLKYHNVLTDFMSIIEQYFDYSFKFYKVLPLYFLPQIKNYTDLELFEKFNVNLMLYVDLDHTEKDSQYYLKFKIPNGPSKVITLGTVKLSSPLVLIK